MIYLVILILILIFIVSFKFIKSSFSNEKIPPIIVLSLINSNRRIRMNKLMADADLQFTYFDGIVIKTQEELTNVLKKMNIADIIAPTDTSWGTVGCALSHISILKYIIDNNFENTLVLEDDVEFYPDGLEQFKNNTESFLNRCGWLTLFPQITMGYGMIGQIVKLSTAQNLWENREKIAYELIIKKNPIDFMFFRTKEITPINVCTSIDEKLPFLVKETEYYGKYENSDRGSTDKNLDITTIQPK